MTFVVQIIVSFFAAAASIYAIYAGRDKATASTYKEMTATITELNDEVRELRMEIRGVYQRMAEIEGEARALRDRVTNLEIENSHLRERLRVVEGYLRRAVRQLQKAQITPDLPQDAIDELFKGT